MPHAFATTLKTFKTASGKDGQLLLAARAGEAATRTSRACRSRCASCSKSVLRNCDGKKVTARARASSSPTGSRTPTRVDEIPFVVARVVLQDFTGVPLLADLAAMRNVADAMGKNPKTIEPLVPVDLVVDHSVMIDHFGTQGRARPEHEARVPAQPASATSS